jgi:hypothetical protein
VVNDIHQDLNLTERLEVAPRNSERHHGPARVRQHAWNDSVKRSFAPGNDIWMAFLDNEAGAPIVQNNTSSRGHDS